MAKEKKTNRLNITQFIIVGIVLLVVFSTTEQKPSDIQQIEDGWDISQQVKDNGYEEFLEETADFDYTDQAIWDKAIEIKQNSKSPAESIRTTMKFVAQNVRYSSDVSVNYCYNEKASLVMETKIGDCVSMVRLVTSLLRAQGIPARTAGGCLSSLRRCKPIFSTVPFAQAQTTAMMTDDFKKRGFLHEWVEVWTPSEGWELIEATSGQKFELDCNAYLLFEYDTNQFDRCVITDNSFWNECLLF